MFLLQNPTGTDYYWIVILIHMKELAIFLFLNVNLSVVIKTSLHFM